MEAGAGFGARTTAMWHLVKSDFWGFGFFYLGVAALLVCLDCAAVWLKLVSHGNAYERTEARAARRQELTATKRHEQELRVAEAARRSPATAWTPSSRSGGSSMPRSNRPPPG